MRPIPVYTALVVALLLPAAALAQGAPARAPGPTEEVILTQSASGEEVRGRLLAMSPTSLAMLVNSTRVEFPLESVL